MPTSQRKSSLFLKQQFLNFSVCPNHLQGLLKYRSLSMRICFSNHVQEGALGTGTRLPGPVLEGRTVEAALCALPYPIPLKVPTKGEYTLVNFRPSYSQPNDVLYIPFLCFKNVKPTISTCCSRIRTFRLEIGVKSMCVQVWGRGLLLGIKSFEYKIQIHHQDESSLTTTCGTKVQLLALPLTDWVARAYEGLSIVIYFYI